MWFQCNAVNASLLLILLKKKKDNFLILLTENIPILNPYPKNPKFATPF